MENDKIDWTAVTEWFGYRPNFHDSEILSIELNREPACSKICVFAFRTLSSTDARGYFDQDKQAVVTFSIYGITEFELRDWNHQNVIDRLRIANSHDFYTLFIDGTFGAFGAIKAKHIEVSLKPYEKVLSAH